MRADKRRLRVALVGCGRVSEHHLGALTSPAVPAELVAVCDVVPEKAEAKGKKYQVPHYEHYEDMLERHPEIELVDIATPTGLHARHTLDMARFGRHVVVEKPMALRREDAAAMIRAVRRTGKRLFIVKQNRFNPAVQAARKAFEEKRFGKLVLGAVRVRWRRDQRYYDADNWHGTWAMDGGVMSQQASHHLDLLQWFMGPVESVQCQSATRLLQIETEDTAAAILRFKGGALGIFEATTAARPEDLECSLSILGEKGSVIIGGRAVNRITYWRFEESRPGDDEIPLQFSQDVPGPYGLGHGPYLGHVIQAILEERPGLVEGPEGLKNVRILEALYESAAWSGRRVRPGARILRSKLGRERGPAA